MQSANAKWENSQPFSRIINFLSIFPPRSAPPSPLPLYCLDRFLPAAFSRNKTHASAPNAHTHARGRPRANHGSKAPLERLHFHKVTRQNKTLSLVSAPATNKVKSFDNVYLSNMKLTHDGGARLAPGGAYAGCRGPGAGRAENVWPARAGGR